MKKEQAYSLTGTLVAIAALVCVLVVCTLSYPPADQSPWDSPKPDVELLPDEYIAPEQMILPHDSGDDEPARGEPVQGDDASPGQASGTDMDDAGELGATLPVQTAENEQPVKQTPQKTPDKDAAARKNEERERTASRNINTSVNNAFTKRPESSAGNNAQAPAKENGGNTSKATTGVTPGARIGNGWSVSHYGPVGAERKPLGSVVIEVEVDAQGNVVGAVPAGGMPPAASDANVVAECLKAAKQSRFSRKQTGDAPARTRGTLTWTFK